MVYFILPAGNMPTKPSIAMSMLCNDLVPTKKMQNDQTSSAARGRKMVEDNSTCVRDEAPDAYFIRRPRPVMGRLVCLYSTRWRCSAPVGST